MRVSAEFRDLLDSLKSDRLKSGIDTLRTSPSHTRLTLTLTKFFKHHNKEAYKVIMKSVIGK